MSETNTTGAAFDAGRPFTTRDGRKAHVAYQNWSGGDYAGSVPGVGDACWDVRGWHKGGDRSLDLVNVAPSTPPPVADARRAPEREDDAAWIDEVDDTMGDPEAGVEATTWDRLIALARRGVTPAEAKPVAWQWPYQRTFNAIAAAIKTPGGLPAHVSVKAFSDAFGPLYAAPPAVGEGQAEAEPTMPALANDGYWDDTAAWQARVDAAPRPEPAGDPVAMEREACAKIADDAAIGAGYYELSEAADQAVRIRDAIRARRPSDAGSAGGVV